MSETYIAERLATQVDRYLRREDSLLAKAVRGICSLEGKDYRNSKFKRNLEIVITTPVAALTIPAGAILGVAAKMEDGGSMFYVQERVGKGGKPVDVVKIRTMKEDAEKVNQMPSYAAAFNPEDDPRNTKLGKKIRAYEIDEFPQFLQVLKGEISLIDLRAIPQYSIDLIAQRRPENFDEWYRAYKDGKPGLLNLNSAINKDRKDEGKRYHYDMLYARKASLGMDLFIIYRTSMRMIRKLEQKVRKMKGAERII